MSFSETAKRMGGLSTWTHHSFSNSLVQNPKKLLKKLWNRQPTSKEVTCYATSLASTILPEAVSTHMKTDYLRGERSNKRSRLTVMNPDPVTPSVSDDGSISEYLMPVAEDEKPASESGFDWEVGCLDFNDEDIDFDAGSSSYSRSSYATTDTSSPESHVNEPEKSVDGFVETVLVIEDRDAVFLDLIFDTGMTAQRFRKSSDAFGRSRRSLTNLI
ncbi:hypothetical protein ASPWEDRAFT_174264 [Aspergillus wentii DTO 134E9]|uniref:Uncharacterized protein n=1 Tax=Aspergillus wentii DTO 134E9 TaxID=1073089 RepID=A0A1L9RD70_ASPWE|nr:uncharacterized protein ASPWEDRAFT_174264 [Aspergillus wentii DTO 134E9]OJJ32828.1 hypothetical protein ASPWEDRAFT_174264 [Aspergillus wentii DTO 134E9]